MKYIITYTAPQKNAKRHVISFRGRKQYFTSLEEAENVAHCLNKRYKVEICNAKYEVVKSI